MNEKRTVILNKLNELNINYEIIEHPPVMTIEQVDNLNLDPHNEIVKNLFLNDDKKRNFLLIVTQKYKKTDLKALGETVGLKHLSFASESRLNQILGLNKGEVTPLSIVNDINKIVKVYIDEDIKKFKRLGVHPNDNTATVWLSPNDLENYILKNKNFFSYIKI